MNVVVKVSVGLLLGLGTSQAFANCSDSVIAKCGGIELLGAVCAGIDDQEQTQFVEKFSVREKGPLDGKSVTKAFINKELTMYKVEDKGGSIFMETPAGFTFTRIEMGGSIHKPAKTITDMVHCE